LRSNTAATASPCDRPQCDRARLAASEATRVADRARPSPLFNSYARSVFATLVSNKLTVPRVGVDLGEALLWGKRRLAVVQIDGELPELVESRAVLGDRPLYLRRSILIVAG
jgi:hypothetical protein